MIRSLLLLTVAALTLVAEDLPPVIRIGTGAGTTSLRPWANGVIGYVGSHRLLEEEFGKDGVRVEWVTIKGAGPGVNEAFASDNLDVAQYGDFPAIIGHAAGIKTRIILNGLRGNNAYLVVPPDSPATSVHDLKGQRISLHKGRPFEIAFHTLLAEQGLKASEFRIFNLAPQDGQVALANHQVEGHFSADGPLLEINGTGRILWSTRHEKNPQHRATSEIFVTDDFATRYPTATIRLVRVFLRAFKYFGDEAHRAEWYDLQAETSTRAVIEREWADSPLRARNNPLIDDYIRAHYRRVADFAKERGLLRQAVTDTDAWFDPAPLQAALAAEGLTSFWTPVSADGANLGF